MVQTFLAENEEKRPTICCSGVPGSVGGLNIAALVDMFIQLYRPEELPARSITYSSHLKDSQEVASAVNLVPSTSPDPLLSKCSSTSSVSSCSAVKRQSPSS